MTYIFATQHGSYLYGTAHSESDRDMFTVVAKEPYRTHNSKPRLSRQIWGTAEDGTLTDSLMVDFSTFMLGCEKGVPQYLEAMFSREAYIDKIEDFRNNFRVGTAVIPTYLRTIRHFSHDERQPEKRKRHALRLAANARSILERGRFDPRLSPEQVVQFTEQARQTPDEVYELAMNMIWN